MKALRRRARACLRSLFVFGLVRFRTPVFKGARKERAICTPAAAVAAAHETSANHGSDDNDDDDDGDDGGGVGNGGGGDVGGGGERRTIFTLVAISKFAAACVGERGRAHARAVNEGFFFVNCAREYANLCALEWREFVHLLRVASGACELIHSDFHVRKRDGDDDAAAVVAAAAAYCSDCCCALPSPPTKTRALP